MLQQHRYEPMINYRSAQTTKINVNQQCKAIYSTFQQQGWIWICATCGRIPRAQTSRPQ